VTPATESPRPKVTLFTRPECHPRDTARFVIESVARETSFDLEIIDIDAPDQDAWRQRYDHHVPVVHVNDSEVARHRVEENVLRAALATI